MNEIELVKQGYEAFSSGDMQRLGKLMAEDVKFTVNGDLPHDGAHTGMSEIIANCFSKIAESWSEFKVLPENYYQSGNTVFVTVDIIAGKTKSKGVHMFVIENEKVVSFHGFEDNDQMRKGLKAA